MNNSEIVTSYSMISPVSLAEVVDVAVASSESFDQSCSKVIDRFLDEETSPDRTPEERREIRKSVMDILERQAEKVTEGRLFTIILAAILVGGIRFVVNPSFFDKTAKTAA